MIRGRVVESDYDEVEDYIVVLMIIAVKMREH
jgi:hypothetical protein